MTADGEEVPAFSFPAYAQIARRWKAWKNGIPPGRRWVGYGGQNPHLMAAFDALDRAESRAAKRGRAQPDRKEHEEFAARMKAQRAEREAGRHV